MTQLPAPDSRLAVDTRGPALSFVFALAATILALAFMVFAALMVANVALISGVQRADLMASPGWLLSGAVSQQIALLLSLPVAFRLFRTPAREALPLKAPTPAQVLGGVVITLGMAPIATTAAAYAQQATGASSASEVVINSAASSPAPLFALWLFVVAVLPGIAEEALFRGFITRLFLPRRWLALGVSTVLFALLHMEIVQGVGTFFLGLGFGLARLLSGSLWPAVIAHATFNGSMLLLARYAELPDDPAATPEPVALLVGAAIVAGGVIILRRGQAAPTTRRSDDG